MNRHSLIFPVSLACLLALAPACSTDGCLDNQSALPKAGLYSSETGGAITLNTLQISGVDAPHDSILIKGGTAVGEFYLPMRATKNSTTWRFHYTQEGLEDYDDVLTFTYQSQPFFASAECGAMYNYLITDCSTTHNLIDSVVIADSLITNVDKVRIQIYFRTRSQSEPDEQS